MMQKASGLLTVCVLSCALWPSGDSNRRAVAQFGGYQEMQLDKIRRQQGEHARQLGRGGLAPSVPGQGGVTNNYFIRPYRYGYAYSDFGWGVPYYAPYSPYGYYGVWPQQPSPVWVQPQIQINPVIVQPQAPGGANAAAPQGQNVPPAMHPGQAAGPEVEILRRVAALRPSNEAGRTRADMLIAEGDREFADQQYRRAAAKYREAIGRAPDYAAGHLRAGHAYTATGDYELAVTYFAMGFELARSIDRGGFSLEALYRGNRLAKEEHLESLADAALRQGAEGGLLFLTGVMLHYDGKPLQARDYFRRAAELPGRHRPYAAMFLPAADQAAAER